MSLTRILKNKSLVAVLVIAALGILVYSSNLRNPLFWDDDEWIIRNEYVQSFDHAPQWFTENVLGGVGLASNYYRPILLLTFAINYAIDGINSLGYHIFSNGLHIANGVLVFWLLYRLFKKRLPAFIAALAFTIHPLQTEAVTYISGRGDPLSVFFMLLVFVLIYRDRQVGERPATIGFWLGHFAALALFILAILSRETAIVFPALLMVYDIAKQPKTVSFVASFKQALRKALPYWSIAVAYFALRLTVLNFENTLNFYNQANDYTQHISYRLYTFGHVLLKYLQLIAAPVGLHMERDLPLKTSLFQWPVWLAILLVLLLGYLTIRFFRRSNRVWFFGWAWFFIALAPVSGIIPINAIMYEHWLYLPLIGFLALIGFYIDRLLSFLNARSRLAGLIVVICLLAYAGFLGVSTFYRNQVWSDPIRFYEDILRYNPNSVRIITNLALQYHNKGDFTKAIELYERAITVPGGNQFAQPYYNLANIYKAKEDLKKAIEYYEKAIAADPDFPFAYQELAIIYANRGQFDKAITALETVRRLRPTYIRVYFNLALVYLADNKIDLARQRLLEGLELGNPDKEAESLMRALLEKISPQ